ncbi:Dbl-domain containing protein [Metarhizium album ARSEF 1941]|uniref:Dbl-domain containing protein n=1 Tax=Metarhizium album (strain ARSEF 1941) TaxID=1081103 RepID=A0A0B2X3H3_METAS|nr:Dbl-domain containing protein [Metarhizium album ARSEF 1941]KHN99860.1 Dbl-domain containing protein [Metarhizium album ARSEF 1941]
MDPAPDAGQFRVDAVDTRPPALGHRDLDSGHDVDRHHHQHHLAGTLSLPIPPQTESFPYTDRDLRANTHDDPSESHQHAPPPSIDPDDFYRKYRGLDGNSSATDLLPMATTSAPRAPLQSNGDGTASLKHLAAVSPTTRSLPRADFRSVSSPLDATVSTNTTFAKTMPTGKPSVKDLKKRFDQNAVAAASAIPLALARVAPVSKPPRSGNSASEHATRSATNPETRQPPALCKSISDVTGSASLPLRQSKSVIDHRTSTSSQSFASRVGKPFNYANGGKPSPSRRCHHRQMPSTSSDGGQPKRLLFGEVLPHHDDASALGFGIDGTRPRRTSESSVQHRSTHNRTPSGLGAEPVSPHAWYRDPPSQRDATPRSCTSRSRPQPHSRAHSDDGSSSPSSRATRNARSTSSSHSSKLPVSVRKFNAPSNSTSPSSTRSSSPSTLRRYQTNGRPTARTSPVASRVKTPTQTRKPPPQGLVTLSGGGGSSNNSRLQAYITTPVPKLSPTLRSSRPRQPVSIASTTSSTMKEPDEARMMSKSGEAPPSRRKISIGPIDFAQRREHIRLAYTKSIRESEALEARQNAAVEKRRQEADDAVAKQQHLEAADSPEIPKSGDSVAASSAAFEITTTDPVQSAKPSMPEAGDRAESPKPLPGRPPLTISTDKETTTALSPDSPTLGLPGTFPDPTLPPIIRDGRPLSATSATSDTTEFDAEPQTNLPVQPQSSLGISVALIKPPSPQLVQDSALLPRTMTEYQYPFDDEPEDDSPLRASPKLPKLPVSELDRDLAVPGSFVDDDEEPNGLGISSLQTRDTAIALVPDSDNQVIAGGDDTQTMPFPRLEVQEDNDSDCQSGLHHLGMQTSQSGRQDDDNDDAATNTGTEETDDREHHDVHDGQFGGHDVRSHGTSTCAPSEAGTCDDVSYSGSDQQQHREASLTGHLLMPNSRYQDERFNRQSAWTDLSVDSTDPSDVLRSPAVPSSRESPAFGNAKIFGSKAESPPNDAHHKKRLSELAYSEDSRRSSTRCHSHHLPEVDTGDGFSVPPHLTSPQTSDQASYVPSPAHEPPPIPASLPGSGLNSRTSSAFYDQAQYESTLLDSERGSDEYMSHAGTSRSVDSASLTTTDQYVSTQTPADSDTKSLAQDGEELSDKDRHRLCQRRNVIKELVDTEAVFVRDMNIVEEIYKGTAEACPKLDGKTIKLIFRNSDEIIAFHTSFLAELKEAVADVYIPKGARKTLGDDSRKSTPSLAAASGEPNDAKDRSTCLGPVFKRNMEQMKMAHEGFLRASDQAAKRLIQIQQDPTVLVWLNECNEVAKDLTAAWDLDSLLIKPMQRITKYPNLIVTLLQHTPQDHPDRAALVEAKDTLEHAIVEINKTKKNFELVGQIVGRKRKESDVRAGFARAFGKRVDKLQASNNNRPEEDADYAKLNEKFGDDYLRLQVVLRDVEFYTRQVSAYVHEFLQYMSSIELVMRLQPGNYPEIESKWVQFNISVRDLEKLALEEHLAQVRKHVIEPFEHVIKAYGNPSLAMKKRQKRRIDYERLEQLKRSGKSPDPKLKELVEQYEALNDTLKKELPQLSALTEKVGNICLGNFVNIQAKWYATWKEKMKTVLPGCGDMPDLQSVVSTFQQDFPHAHDQMSQIGILNPATWGRMSQATSVSADDVSLRARSRPSDVESRSRGQSLNGDVAPTLPAPDFGGRRSGSFTMSPGYAMAVAGFGIGNVPNSHQYDYRDYYAGIHANQAGPASPKSAEMASSSRPAAVSSAVSTRPSTGRSFEPGSVRQSSDSAAVQHRDSSATYGSTYTPQATQREPRRISNLFQSALPMSDGPDDGGSQRASRASSRERSQTSDGYNVLWLAASLFEFNISTTKHEAGYPYLTYQAGEIFDVVAEKGELWLAKNQDDTTDQVGWIWSKHFARLADS